MTKIEFLKELARGWFGNSQQHSIQAQLLKARGLNKLADKMMAESDEEWEEAKKVNARLIELGETPAVEIEAYPVFTDIKEMLEYDCKDAAEALPTMSKALSMFDDDYVTRHMIEEFIIEEQNHFNWVKVHLCLIEQIGMENYIIEMLGE
ncbi:MAG: ferritin-like domain-containing protein [Lachnospiraceae bacterium]|nr:ferritin-like domain-containing protein [Lachnospiraceae bacterium]